MKSIQDYQKYINIYSKRLKSNQEAHEKRQASIKSRIKNWKNSLDKLIKTREDLKSMVKKIHSDTNIDIKKQKTARKGGVKSGFYKIALERGIKATAIADFMEVNPKNVRKGRKLLNQNISKPKVRNNFNNIKKILNEEN